MSITQDSLHDVEESWATKKNTIHITLECGSTIILARQQGSFWWKACHIVTESRGRFEQIRADSDGGMRHEEPPTDAMFSVLQ